MQTRFKMSNSTKYIVRSATAQAILLLALSALFSISFASEGLKLTALDYYVQEPDEHYKYSIHSTVEGDGYKTHIVEMTSQKWLTENEVNLPIWEHVMLITVPDNVLSDIGFLYITGGSKSNSMPTQAVESDIKRALESGTVVSTLHMVPNQPLEFIEDGISRTEDSIIAYTWDRFFRTGDEKWPLRLPMTKSAVRAMDTITSVMMDSGMLEVGLS